MDSLGPLRPPTELLEPFEPSAPNTPYTGRPKRVCGETAANEIERLSTVSTRDTENLHTSFTGSSSIESRASSKLEVARQTDASLTIQRASRGYIQRKTIVKPLIMDSLNVVKSRLRGRCDAEHREALQEKADRLLNVLDRVERQPTITIKEALDKSLTYHIKRNRRDSGDSPIIFPAIKVSYSGAYSEQQEYRIYPHSVQGRGACNQMNSTRRLVNGSEPQPIPLAWIRTADCHGDGLNLVHKIVPQYSSPLVRINKSLIFMKNGGTSLDKVYKNPDLTEEQMVHISSQLLDCIKRLHLNGFIHRDIKPGNIIIDSQYNMMIIDFDMSTFFNSNQDPNSDRLTYYGNSPNNHCGTACHISPEAIMAVREKDRLSDIKNNPDMVDFKISIHKKTYKITEDTTIEGERTLTMIDPDNDIHQLVFNINDQTGIFDNEAIQLDTIRFKSPQKEIEFSYSDLIGIDYWALGITMYQILLGDHPIEDERHLDETVLCDKTLQLDIMAELKPTIEQIIQMPDNPSELFYLMCQCVQLLQQDSEDRLIIEDEDISGLRAIETSISKLIAQKEVVEDQEVPAGFVLSLPAASIDRTSAIMQLKKLKTETPISVIQELVQDTITQLESDPYSRCQLDPLYVLNRSINLFSDGYLQIKTAKKAKEVVSQATQKVVRDLVETPGKREIDGSH